jgi:hypothetical protein
VDRRARHGRLTGLAAVQPHRPVGFDPTKMYPAGALPNKVLADNMPAGLSARHREHLNPGLQRQRAGMLFKCYLR